MRPETSQWMSEEHLLLRDSVRKFLGQELVPNIERWRKAGVVDQAFWEKAGEAGLLAASIPESYGGAGGSNALDAVIMYEQALTGDTAWGFSVHNIVTHYVVGCGTDEQKARWLPKLASGEWVGAIAMSEPGTGSDLQAVRTNARIDGDELVINGSKTFITNGQNGRLVLVVTKTGPGEGARGISLVAVETEHTEGFIRGRMLDKLGLKGQDTSELFFEEMRVPKANVLGGEMGRGFYQLMQQLPWERLIIGIMAVGASDYAIEQTVEYAKHRKAFSQRVMDFQNTRFKLAEAKTKLEVTRAFIDQCITQHEAGKLDAATGSMAKLWGSEMQGEIIDECLQLHGGYGFMSEYPISHLYADARVQRIYGGTNEIMKELIARDLDD
ncbi:MAG: acyl-CoA dehydrogenase family protein [Pseudomonadota bacterium]